MVKKLAVLLLVVVALLLPSLAGHAFDNTASQPLSNTAGGSANSIAPAAIATPRPLCRLGAWGSAASVGVLRPGGYIHVDTLADAKRYFPGLQGKNVLRAFRCPSLACMDDLGRQARAQGIPFDAFAYDLEGWDKTPLWERENQVAATRQARATADRYSVKLVMGAARAFTWRNWPQMAPYAHWWIIQAQGGQRQFPAGAGFANWLSEYVHYLDTNPNLKIWAQLSTVPDTALTLSQYMAYVDSIKPSLIDGVYVFNPQSHLSLSSIWNAECGR